VAWVQGTPSAGVEQHGSTTSGAKRQESRQSSDQQASRAGQQQQQQQQQEAEDEDEDEQSQPYRPISRKAATAADRRKHLRH
jgi:hypothetical protein